jgi:geranylgeranyl diphosphate synthase, type II
MHNEKELLKLVNEAIEADPFNGEPRELYEPLDYILALGGKRIRPVMLLMAAEMFGGDPLRAMPTAIGIELFHNFSLIHDDIMDNAPIRRGKPTVHVKWSANAAILSGDTMLVKAYESILKVPESILKQALTIFNQTALEVCEGQQYDMNFESLAEVTIPDYMKMIRLKTAVLIGASLHLGGLVAGASADDLHNLYEFGIHTGMAFQLRDDLLDTFGDEKTFGKRQYGDIRANKKTFLFLKALEMAMEKDKERLKALFSGFNGDVGTKITETLDIFQKTKVKELTETEIEGHHRIALDYFKKIGVPSGQKRILLNYTEMLAGRTI